MKKSFLVLLTLLLLVYTQVNAQVTTTTATTLPKYLGMIELGYLYQDNEDNSPNTSDSSPTLTVFSGYQFHRRFSLGATVGLDFYNQVLITPIALAIRGTLLDTRVSPFYSLDAGYGTALLSDESDNLENEGGWMFNPAVGVRITTGNATAFALSLGYKTQKATSNITLPWNNNSEITEEYTFKRLSARIGFMF